MCAHAITHDSQNQEDSVELDFTHQNVQSLHALNDQGLVASSSPDENKTAQISARDPQNVGLLGQQQDMTFNEHLNPQQMYQLQTVHSAATIGQVGKDSPHWSSHHNNTGNALMNQQLGMTSHKGTSHYDSSLKRSSQIHESIATVSQQVPLTEGGNFQSYQLSASPSKPSPKLRHIFRAFVEKLLLKDQLHKVQEFLQKFESIVLTMCCKENPDLYNNLIMDLQGFNDIECKNHLEILEIVTVQADRLSQLLTTFLASKYDMRKFSELMSNIISPSDSQQALVQDTLLDVANSSIDNLLQPQKQNKSFSFEGSSAGLKTKGALESGKHQAYLRSQKTSGGHPNPFQLEQMEESPNELHSTEEPMPFQTGEDAGESPRSPLKFEEMKLCNEMIDRLKAECREYELLIVEQDKEIEQLREVIKTNPNNQSQQRYTDLERQENKSLIQRLKLELNNQKADFDHSINQANHTIKALEMQLRTKQPERLDFSHKTEQQMTMRELESLKHDYAVMEHRCSETTALLRQKEVAIQDVERNAQRQMKQAQQDAEECITYFKTLAIQAKGGIVQQKEVRNNAASNFPVSLQPITSNEQQLADTDFALFKPERSRSVPGSSKANQQKRKSQDFSFQSPGPNSPQVDKHPAECENETFKFLIAIEHMSKAFEEISTIKTGLLRQILSFRDLFVEKQKSFSHLSYDLLDSLQKYAQYESKMIDELEKQQMPITEIKMVCQNQQKHIKAQNELVMAQKDKLIIFEQILEKALKSKEKDRQAFARQALSELPLLADVVSQTTGSVEAVISQKAKMELDIRNLVDVHDLSKKKVKMLEEELEKSLSQSEKHSMNLKENQTKHERLVGLIHDVWVQEVQNGGNQKLIFQKDNQQSSEQTAAMPVNWLSEIRVTIHQLREANDFQKDECFQMLNLINTSSQRDEQERTETDRQTYQSGQDEEDEEPNVMDECVDSESSPHSKGIDDLHSQVEQHTNGQSRNQRSKYQSTSRSRQEAVHSPRPVLDPRKPKSITSTRSNPRYLQQHMTEKHELNERPIRSTSADHKSTRIVSQRTPKNVRFNQPVLPSSMRSLGPKLNQLSTSNGSYRAPPQRNELQQMLRDEIMKLKRESQVGRETVLQMQLEIKALRREASELNQDNEQLNQDLHTQLQRGDQLIQDLRDAHSLIEEAESTIQDRESQIDDLKARLETFEAEISEMQDQMTQVAQMNHEVGQQSQQWEQAYQQLQADYTQQQENHQQTQRKLSEAHDERCKALKRKIQEKEQLLQEFTSNLQSFEQTRQEEALLKAQRKEQGTEPSEFLPALEVECAQLKTQLAQVKLDINAVLEQYDRQIALNKALRKKYDKLKAHSANSCKEVEAQKAELEAVKNENLKQIESYKTESQEQERELQSRVRNLEQENSNLILQIEDITQFAENVQCSLKQQTQEHEQAAQQASTTVQSLESKIREMLADSHKDKQVITRQREKIASLKSLRSQHMMSQTRAAQPAAMHERSRIKGGSNISQDFSSESHSSHSEMYQQPKQQRQSYHNQQVLRNQNISPQPQQNPFASNMSGGQFDSLRNPASKSLAHNEISKDRCLSALSNCVCGAQGSQKPGFLPNFVSQNEQFAELKAKAEATKASKQKLKKVLKYIEDLLKLQCRTCIEKSQSHGADEQRRQNSNRHVQEWSAEQLLDCWATDESSIIEAKAYFNKHSPLIMNCLNLLADQCNSARLESKASSQQFIQPPTLGTSHQQIPQVDNVASHRQLIQVQEDSQQSTYRSMNDPYADLQNQHKDLIEAYGLLANHCHGLLQTHIQMGRSLAGICFGGTILLGNSIPQELKDQVDYAMKFLNQDTSLIDSTHAETMSEIHKVVDSLISCLQQIVKSSCQVILSKSNLSQQDANRMIESVQQSCDFTFATNSRDKTIKHTASVQSKTNSASCQVDQQAVQQTHDANNTKEVKDRLQNVESRLKSKFAQVSKLEESLDKLLSHPHISHDFSPRKPKDRSDETLKSQASIESNTSSGLSDTKTVMKLIASVRRVVSKLKLELHQDYLSLGHINVGLLRTSSLSSYNLSENQGKTKKQHCASVQTVQQPKETIYKENIAKTHRTNVASGSVQNSARMKEEISKIISDMSGLTFDESLPQHVKEALSQRVPMSDV